VSSTRIRIRLLLTISLIGQFSFNPSLISPVAAFKASSKYCQGILQEANRLDANTKNRWTVYQKSLKLAKKTNMVEDNLKQTSNLLKTLESDRSLFIFLLNSKNCISSSERKNIQWDLQGYTERSQIVLSWIETEIGIPPFNYYNSFIDWKRNLEEPKSGYFCERKGLKKEGFECQQFPDGLFWKSIKEASVKKQENSSMELSDFIDGKVSLYGAKTLAKKLYEEVTVNFSQSPMKAYESIKKLAYPGLYDFNSARTSESCKIWTEATLVPGSYSITFTPDLERMRPDPGFTIKDDSGGQLIINQTFKGQVFVSPVTIQFREGERLVGDPIVRDLRVAVVDGIMYRFAGC
jgi:hypothetical protein